MIILPTKRIKEENSLIGLGAILLDFLDRPKTVSQLWDKVKKRYIGADGLSSIPFDWFILSLDLLFLINVINSQEGLITKAEK